MEVPPEVELVRFKVEHGRWPTLDDVTPPEGSVRIGRTDQAAFALAVEVHGSPEAAHAAWVERVVRDYAAANRLACHRCGAQAVTYAPRDPLFVHPSGHYRAGLPVEPTGHGTDDRFAICAGTIGFCDECVEHRERGDLTVAIARAVLDRAGQDSDDALDAALAAAIAAALPRYRGTAVEPWSWLGRDDAVALVAAARATAADRAARTGECGRCHEVAVLSFGGPWKQVCARCLHVLSRFAR